MFWIDHAPIQCSQQAGGLKRGAESPDGWSEGEKRRQVKPQEDGPPCKKFHGAPAQSRAEQSFHPGRAAKDGTPPETNAEAYRGSIEALRHPDHGPGDVPGEMTSLRQHGQEMTEYDPQDKARIDAELDGKYRSVILSRTLFNCSHVIRISGDFESCSG